MLVRTSKGWLLLMARTLPLMIRCQWDLKSLRGSSGGSVCYLTSPLGTVLYLSFWFESKPSFRPLSWFWHQFVTGWLLTNSAVVLLHSLLSYKEDCYCSGLFITPIPKWFKEYLRSINNCCAHPTSPREAWKKLWPQEWHYCGSPYPRKKSTSRSLV